MKMDGYIGVRSLEDSVTSRPSLKSSTSERQIRIRKTAQNIKVITNKSCTGGCCSSAGQFGLPQCGPQAWADISTGRPSPQCGPTYPTVLKGFKGEKD